MADTSWLLANIFAAETPDQLHAFLAEHSAEVVVAFPAWTTVPEPLRADEGTSRTWATRIIEVARTLADLGYPGPMARLQSGNGSNPIADWYDAFARARALADLGRFAESTATLTELLEALDRARGTVVDDLRPKVYGKLGANQVELGNLDSALEWTERALAASVANNDVSGVRAYRENLQVLEAIHLPSVDPVAGALLLECRLLIVSAQRASDQFKYDESNALLDRALVLVTRTDKLRDSFAGKIYGLRGWNEYYLNHQSSAITNTRRALDECIRQQDLDGVRIYTANIAFLEGPPNNAPEPAS
jgi:tetratricopeptide (TPR) repeat protein